MGVRCQRPDYRRHRLGEVEAAYLIERRGPVADQYEQNQRRFAANDLGGGSKGITGRAPTLLNALVRCGRCGKPMGARNARADANPH